MTDSSRRQLHEGLSRLGSVDYGALVDARVTMHWAVQAVASFGFSALPKADDYSHTALHWCPASRVLCSQVEPQTGVSVALDIESFSLVVRRGSADPFEEFARRPLDGLSLDGALEWLGGILRHAGVSTPEGVVVPGHLDELPPLEPRDEPSQSQRLRAPSLVLRQELAAWYEAADGLLSTIVRDEPGMSAVLCWPHHFDTATLHVLDGEGEDSRSVGVGISPGDGSYAEPYIYVTPWPYPDAEGLPSLPSGHWHTEGWTGAVMLANDIVPHSGGEARAEAIFEFLSAARAAALDRLSKGER